MTWPDIGSHEKPDIVTCDTISGHYVTDIGENADIGGGNNPDYHTSII